MNKNKRKKQVKNLVFTLGFLGDGGVVKPDGFISIIRPHHTYKIDKIIIQSLLSFVGNEYKIIDEKRYSDGYVFHTNLKQKTLCKFDPYTKVEIKVKKEDLNLIGDFEGVNTYDGTMIIFCRKESFNITKRLLSSILKCYGVGYKITVIKEFDDDYMVVGTNLPSKFNETSSMN